MAKRKKRNKTKWINQWQRAEKEAAKEKRRLKALPLPLRQLETELDFYVDFEMVYDGYIGDFTGEIRPSEPVNNPFWILKQMDIKLPDIQTLKREEVVLYNTKITEVFERMYFDTGFHAQDEEMEKRYYQFLRTAINNSTDRTFGDYERINEADVEITIMRISGDEGFF